MFSIRLGVEEYDYLFKDFVIRRVDDNNCISWDLVGLFVVPDIYRDSLSLS